MLRSRRSRRILFGAVAAVGIGAATVAFTDIGSQTVNTAKLELISAAAAHGGGWRGRGGSHGVHRFCSDERGRKLEDAISFVEAFFSFNEAQTAAWTEFTASLNASNDIVGKHCEAFVNRSSPMTAPEKLQRAETFLSAGLDIVRQVQPSFRNFYATLSDAQQSALDKLLSRRGRH